jgi:integrase
MIRQRGDRFLVELFSPEKGRTAQVRPGDYGLRTPRNRLEAEQLEAMALLDYQDALTVEQYADRHCTRQFTDAGRSVSRQTNDHNRQQLKDFIEVYGSVSMDSITRLQAKDYVVKHPSRLREVSAMFNAAVADDVISVNPFAKLKVPQRKGSKDVVVPTLEEVKALGEAALVCHGAWGYTFRAMILFAAWTGLRPGEAAGAKWEHLHGSKYEVVEQYLLKYHKFSGPKWGSVGTVHVFDAGLEAIFDAGMAAEDSLPRENELMFPAKMGGPMSGAQLHSALNPVRILAGLPGFTFKGLRHFHASYLLNELGLPPYTIAQQLRHSDGGELIVNTYGHADRGVHLERISIAEKAYTATAADDNESTVI